MKIGGGGEGGAARRMPSTRSPASRARTATTAALVRVKGRAKGTPSQLSTTVGVAEDELLDLAGRGLGQLAELDRFGRFEVRDPRADVLDDVLLARLLAGLQAHECLGDLAPAIVGDRDHGAFEHGRVACDRLLHL